MKMHGKKIEGVNEEIVVIPRNKGDDIVFTARAILNYDDFDKLCPMPKAKMKLMKGGERVQDLENPEFKKQIAEWGQKRSHWIILTSLRATEGLEWESVDYGDPGTWGNYVQELLASGLTDSEASRVINAVVIANGLDEKKLEEARNRFLAGKLEALERQLSPVDEGKNTLSGVPVNGSISVHQESTEVGTK